MSLRYGYGTLHKQLAVPDIGIEATTIFHVFGSDATKRENIALIADDVLVYVVSNSVVFENIITRVKTYLVGVDEGGIGCIAVHPSRKLFAVGGVGYQPSIYIYDYPTLQVTSISSLMIVFVNGLFEGFESSSRWGRARLCKHVF